MYRRGLAQHLGSTKKQKKGLKLSNGIAVSGKGCSTKVIIGKMQNYYGIAIRNNKGNQLEMKRSRKAIHHHSIKSENLSAFK